MRTKMYFTPSRSKLLLILCRIISDCNIIPTKKSKEQLLPLLIQQAISGISKSIPDIIDQHLAQRDVISVSGSDNIDMDVENDQRDIGARYNERDIGAQDKERDIGSQKPLVEDSGSQGFNEGAEGAKRMQIGTKRIATT